MMSGERDKRPGPMEGGARARSTTVVAVVRDGKIAVAADGQVTLGETVMKMSAEKVRRIAKGRAIVGFAGEIRESSGQRPTRRRRAGAGLAYGSSASQARGDATARG